MDLYCWLPPEGVKIALVLSLSFLIGLLLAGLALLGLVPLVWLALDTHGANSFSSDSRRGSL